MAKCVYNRNTGAAVRVSDDTAADLVNNKGYKYVSKTEYRSIKSVTTKKKDRGIEE